jgi:hypothetical protein
MVTGCEVPTKQNSEPQLHLLAAASRAYARAKRFMALQLILTVPAALASSLLMAWKPTWKVWLTFFSVSVALLDALWLDRRQARLKQRGAALQQMFDCALFELPWRQLRCGPPVDDEDILTDAKAQLRGPKVRTLLLDWYPAAVKTLPLPLARLVCQRASLWWDLRQRDRVRGALTATLAVLAAAIFLIALLQGNTVEQMILTVYVPLAPAVLWALREILAQRDAIHADERGLAFVETLWKQALEQKPPEAVLAQQSVLVQDALFDARSRSPLVFNWVYSLLRKQKQEQMQHKAEQLVKEALAVLESSKPHQVAQAAPAA